MSPRRDRYKFGYALADAIEGCAGDPAEIQALGNMLASTALALMTPGDPMELAAKMRVATDNHVLAHGEKL